MVRKLPLLLLAGLPGVALAADASGGGGMGLLVGLAALVLVCAGLVAAKRPWGLVVSALAGLTVAGVLYAEHNAIKAGAASTICSVSATIDCTAAAQSAYAEISGVPIALIGMAYFAAMAFLAVRHALGQSPTAPASMAVLAVLAVGYDAFLAWVTFTKLSAVCPLCMTTWGLNVVLLVGSLLALRDTGTSFGSALAQNVPKDGANAAIVGLAALVVLGWVGRTGDTASGGTTTGAGKADVDIAHAYEQVNGQIQLDGTEPVKGNPEAKYTLVEWADFQCPHCALMKKELEDITVTNPDLKYLYKNYPISGICNRFVDGDRHTEACGAAAAGECARQQGKFWELESQMFENQEYLGKDDLKFMVKQLGLDQTAFEACMENPVTAEAVKADVEAGGAAGVNGTPSLFLKGPFGDQWVRVVGGKDAINAILAKARKGETLPPPGPPTDQ